MDDNELHEEENPTNSAVGELDDAQDFITTSYAFGLVLVQVPMSGRLGLSNSWALMCWVCYVS